MNRFQKHYENIVCYDLLFKDYFINVMQLPKVYQITINTGIGLGAVLDKRRILTALLGLELVSGQRPEITRAKKSIDKFKLREKMPVGVSVTLRGERMYSFLDRLVNLALPRIRDFKGISIKSFDGRGNYNIGIKEQLMFPEIEYDRVDQIRGLDIAITTTAKTQQEGIALLKALGMPFNDN